MEFSEKEKNELLKIARNAVTGYIEKNQKVYPDVQNDKFLQKRGVFVSLYVNEDLRGCIGYPLPYKELYKAIVDNAISAASEDIRFQSIVSEEIDKLKIEISVLTVPESVNDYSDIKVGEHGILVSKGNNKGLLLPQVPVKYGWNREEYISHGCLKAGLPNDEWRRGVEIKVFKAIVFSEE